MRPEMRRRVVVTGIGVVSAIGVGAEAFWRACLAGETRVEAVPEEWLRFSEYRSRLWSPLPELDLAPYPISRLEGLQQDATALMALISTFQALAAAGLSWEVANSRRNTLQVPELDPERVTVVMGTGIGGVSSLLSSYRHHILSRPRGRIEEVARQLKELAGEGAPELAELASCLPEPGRMNPLAVPMAMPNTAAAAVSIKFSLQGASHTHCSACAAGTVAIGHAFWSLRSGRADVAVAGGVEFMDDRSGGLFRAFDLARTLVQDDGDPERANRPFDKARSGFLFSQGGGAVLLLEELEHARRRGAPVLAEIAGFAETSDAHNVMALAPGGRQIRRAIEEALADAGLQPEQIDYVNAHGTGTAANDVIEAEVLAQLFGRRVAVNSTKSLLGHSLGASGALEAAVTALSLHHQITHPSRNLDEPIADLDFVRQARPRSFGAALSQSFAFGGHNAALVLRHCGKEVDSHTS